MYEKKTAVVGTLKKGDTIIIDDSPCKITDLTVSKSGKHGHAKANITAVGLLDEKKRNIVVPSQEKIDVPIIDKRTAQVLSVASTKASVMDIDTFETFELDIPSELAGDVSEGKEVLYWTVMGQKVIKQVK